MLGDNSIKLRATAGRYYIEAAEEKSEHVEDVLSRLTGISGWAKTRACQKTPDAVIAACVEEGKELAKHGIKTFKIEARRTDKSFPLNSYELCCNSADAITDEVNMTVDVRNPQDIIRIEIREKAYVYSGGKKGLGGLPVGTAGRGLLLLSGGIDSPVAGFMMAGRGMNIDAIHFHSYPYTSKEAKQKAVDLSGVLGKYSLGLRIFILNFTKVQMRIKEAAPADWMTIILRMAMMEASEKAATKIKSKCLITGESLSQVASQTIENLSCTQSRIKLPVLRPLIGLNKESIIKEAKKIGTYNISIQPYEDCCTLFNPKHPVIHGNPQTACKLYEALELEPLIDEALKGYEEAVN
uniref:Probable tRNA sulfurtransferase n=1 Tax=uncultured bacterium contig00019 TaxID=1181510 RepID=A0A806KQ44_9BACT|nr:thiamine biosynthesis protein thiI [uncultured bacterium contig00019]